MAQPEGWRTVRVRAATKERLRALARRLTQAAARGGSAVEQSDQPCTGGPEGGVTLDGALARALDVYEAHLARGTRGKGRARSKGPGPTAGTADMPATDAGDPLPDRIDLGRLEDLGSMIDLHMEDEDAEREKGGAL